MCAIQPENEFLSSILNTFNFFGDCVRKSIACTLFCLSFPLCMCWGSNEMTLREPSANSLNRYQKVVYSQFGEDGIIEEIFNRLQIRHGVFIEFGAADGKWLSNTRYLWEKGWKGLMIEAGSRFFDQLKEEYKESDRMLCLHYFVTPHPLKDHERTLDQIIQEHLGGTEIDFLSIDIDGLDYQILETLRSRPKVICIETNLFWHPNLKVRVPDEVAAHNLNQPLSVVLEIAKKQGYLPVCQTINLFLVRQDLYGPFQQTPSDPITLWRDGLLSLREKNIKRIINLRERNKYIKAYESLHLSEEERRLPLP